LPSASRSWARRRHGHAVRASQRRPRERRHHRELRHLGAHVERDPALIGIANGGTSRSVNEDDGDLNFDKNKAFANIVKATVDAELKWRNFGFFGRGSAYYDFDLHDSDKLGRGGRKRLGKDVVGLDGFFSGAFDLGGRT
jgi:hypothetical protein